jgi:Spy/CpxP family protein refolding chaperone
MKTGKIENTKKGKRLFLGRILFGLLLFLSISLSVQPLEAQQPFSKQDKPILRGGSQKAYSSQSPGLVLTKEQAKALEVLHHAYMAEAMPLRRELLSLRIELRHSILNPKVQSKTLLDLQRRISELQAQLESLSLSYQIKARSLLTEEQLGRLPEECLSGVDTGFEMMIGIGRGPQRGHR